jgi:hypothetical protein
MKPTTLRVTSHVGRDLLQSAQLFKHEHAVVWEYVSNGLQYKDLATRPTVVVEIDPKSKTIQVSDNGRGMRMQDLQRYFQMHGENLDRKQGRPGRGFFGTGKSAAFGIANALTITTVRDGRRSKVQLSRADIEAHPDGDAIPVKILENEVTTVASNGTVIQIDEVFLKHLDIGGVVRYIERQIAHWPDTSVVINKHECEYSEPDISREIKLPTKGTEYEKLLGDTELTIKVAKSPLEDELRGVAILSNGIWHETTLAGCDRKSFSEYLFGTLDVPTLDRASNGVPAFDMSRSMKLNPRNEVVAAIIRFIGVNLEIVRKDLERQDRERRQTEEQKRLQRQGSKIAELINERFKEWSSKLKATMAKAGTGSDILLAKKKTETDDIGDVFGTELPAVIAGNEVGKDVPEPGANSGTGLGPNPPSSTPRAKVDEGATDKLAKKAEGSLRKVHAGGFNVAFEKIGVNEKRAKYNKETRTIVINLEHPRIAMELKNVQGQMSVDDPNFQRMAYEIAFTEYAIVLAQELSKVGFYFDPQDALVELRQTLDDLSKAFASIWRPGQMLQ